MTNVQTVSGLFICPSNLPQTRGVNNIPNNWTLCFLDDNLELPLTFIANQTNSRVTLSSVIGEPIISGLQFRTNSNTAWTSYNINTEIQLNAINDWVQFKNIENNLSTSSNNYVTFVMNGKIKAKGNIQSLLNYSNSCSNYCYYKLFENCSIMLTAPELPATTLADNCYQSMFYNCQSLTIPPELPATTLAYFCYSHMFMYCRRIS